MGLPAVGNSLWVPGVTIATIAVTIAVTIASENRRKRVTAAVTIATIAALKADNWIDSGTRAVFVEFNVAARVSYLYASAILAVEFPAFGGGGWLEFAALRFPGLTRVV